MCHQTLNLGSNTKPLCVFPNCIQNILIVFLKILKIICYNGIILKGKVDKFKLVALLTKELVWRNCIITM